MLHLKPWKMESLGFASRVFLAASCVLLFNGWHGASATAEIRLIKQLLNYYDVDARPVKNHSQPISVQLKLIYNELLEINEPKQTIKSVISFVMKWTDVSMHWIESDYEDIASIRIDPSRVWKPDLTMYDSVDKESGSLYNFKTKIIVKSNGTMEWLAYGIVESSCRIDIARFPFDQQTCSIKIGSWSFNSQAFQLSFYDQKEPIFLGYFKNNTEWDLLSVTPKRNLVNYKCCPVPFYDLTYTFHLRRKPLYYIMSIVFPCVLLSLLSTISYLFPADSGERVSLVVSVLLGLFVFMLIVNGHTPVSSDTVPMISIYFTVIGFEVFLTLFATAFILWMHHASSARPVPYFLTKISCLLASVLCVEDASSTRKTYKKLKLREALLNVKHEEMELSCVHVKKLLGQQSGNTGGVQKILSEIRRFSQRLIEDDLKDKIKEEWQHTAKIFDKFFFFFFLLNCIILNGYILSFVY